ncbi:urotensin-2-like [Heteronotia binoei]|uniref:urotensin-2-like n=1 Tax=Heteronotia binoei TaxID=13085 RepID=UPI00292F6DD3|nr:urotensin-2-like [Heteronotia binoei]
MEKLGWSCFFLVSLSGPLWALPVASSREIAYWISAASEDPGLNLKALNGRKQSSLRQTLPKLLVAQVDSQPSKSGLGPNSFTSRESTKEVLLGNLPRNALLNRLLGKDRKRGSLSECFWKYCV